MQIKLPPKMLPTTMTCFPEAGPAAKSEQAGRNGYYGPYSGYSNGRFPHRVNPGQCRLTFEDLPADPIAPGGALGSPPELSSLSPSGLYRTAGYPSNEVDHYLYNAIQVDRPYQTSELQRTFQGGNRGPLVDASQIHAMDFPEFGHPCQPWNTEYPDQLVETHRPLETISKGKYPTPDDEFVDFNFAHQEYPRAGHGCERGSHRNHNGEPARSQALSISCMSSGSGSSTRTPASGRQSRPQPAKCKPSGDDRFQSGCVNSFNPGGPDPRVHKKRKPSVEEKRLTRAIARRGGVCAECRRKKKKV